MVTHTCTAGDTHSQKDRQKIIFIELNQLIHGNKSEKRSNGNNSSETTQHIVILRMRTTRDDISSTNEEWFSRLSKKQAFMLFFSRKLRQSHAKKRLKCGLGSLPSQKILQDVKMSTIHSQSVSCQAYQCVFVVYRQASCKDFLVKGLNAIVGRYIVNIEFNINKTGDVLLFLAL